MREHAPLDGFSHLLFEYPDIVRLASLMMCINDVCIDGCIPLLFSALNIPSTHNFVIFSTYHLTHIRYHATNHVLWRATAYTKFWTKGIWIIPIHHPLQAHWVLCIAHLSHRELHLFDSLGEQKPWKTDIHTGTMCLFLPVFALMLTLTGCHGTHHPIDDDRTTEFPRGSTGWPQMDSTTSNSAFPPSLCWNMLILRPRLPPCNQTAMIVGYGF